MTRRDNESPAEHGARIMRERRMREAAERNLLSEQDRQRNYAAAQRERNRREREQKETGATSTPALS